MDLTASVGLRLQAAEIPGAVRRLTEQLAAEPTPEVRAALGLLLYLFADFAPAARHMEEAYLAYRAAGRAPRAALAASHLARIHQDGIGAESVASGWLARAERLLAGEDDCVERGRVALPLTGCNVPDADDLRRRAELALSVARRFDDVDLECKALADTGLALIAFGVIDEGLRHIDEAMAMASSGECANAFITAQIRCCLVSACERIGDLARLAGWLSVTTAQEPELLGPDARPNLLLSHCHSELGLLLCQAGRWEEAEAALQRAATSGESIHFHSKAQTRAALAALRAEGLANPQIARRLVISPKTAEHHVGAILRKLGISSRSEAAVYAVTAGRSR